MSSPDADETTSPDQRSVTPDQPAHVGGQEATAHAGAPAASGPGPASGRASTHRRGNWRSLVISMVLLALVVFAFVALVPRPAQRDRTTVDVARSAAQLAVEKGWPLGVLQAGEGWHPTSVSLAPDESGVPTWQVGYHSRPGDARYVVLSQTRVEQGVTPDMVQAWIIRQARQSRVDGNSTVAGRTWQRRSVVVPAGDGDRVSRALVAAGDDVPGGLVTVLAGEVDYPTLEALAAGLQQTSAQPTAGSSPSLTTPLPSSSAATSSPSS